MSAPTRHATFPLDCDAYHAANKKVRQAMTNDPDESDPNRRIRTDGSDEHYRQMWMDAYIEAGGDHKPTPQRRKPGQPVTTCQAPEPPTKPPPKPGVTQLIIQVNDDDGVGVPGARVSGVLVPDKNLKGTTDSIGIVVFSNIDSGRFHFSVEKSGWHSVRDKTDVKANETNIKKIKLKSKTHLVVKVVDGHDGTPIRNANVIIAGPSFASHRTRNDGRAEFLSIEPGEYEVRVRKHPWRDFEGSTMVTEARSNTMEVTLKGALLFRGSREVSAEHQETYTDTQIGPLPARGKEFFEESFADCEKDVSKKLDPLIEEQKNGIRKRAKGRSPQARVGFDIKREFNVDILDISAEPDRDAPGSGFVTVDHKLTLLCKGKATITFHVRE